MAAAKIFAWLNDAPETGIDPLLLALALIVIQALAIASLIGWIVWRDREPPRVGPDDPMWRPFGDVIWPLPDRRLIEGYCPGCGLVESSCICFMHASVPYHPRDPLRRSYMRDHFDSAGLALRSDADGGGRAVPSWSAAIGNFFRGGLHG